MTHAHNHGDTQPCLWLGVVVAGAAILLTGWQWLDPAVSLLVAAVVFWSTWGLLRDSVNLALDAVPAEIDPAQVHTYLARLPAISSEAGQVGQNNNRF